MKVLAALGAAAAVVYAAAPSVSSRRVPPIESAYRAAAERGSVRAQAVLGFLMLEREPEQAIAWLLKAAESGDTECQIASGDFLKDRGRYREAAYWYSRASQHSFRAAYLLGTMYEFGEGVDQSYPAAVQLYRRAALHGVAEAENRLGNLHMIGAGVAQDYEEARRWYLRSAAKGYGEALLNLAGLFFHGLGVDRDVPTARGWALAARRVNAREADDFLRVIESGP